MKPASESEVSIETSGTKVIQDPYSIQRLYTDLVKSAESEILLFLPTSSAFLREQKIGIIRSLIAAARRGVNINVLTAADEKFVPNMETMLHGKDSNIAVRSIKQRSSQSSEEARTKILVIDRKEYLIVELKDDSKDTFVDAVRLAIYSDTQSTVRSYLTLFESLWEQSDLYEQLETQEKIQKEFINIAAHELRTPIQPILALMEILYDGSRDGDEKIEIEKKEFELLLRNAKRLEHLSSAILEVTRIETNSIKLNEERFDINEQIKNAILDVKTFSNLGNKLAIIHEHGEPIFVEADRTRIFEVLSNIIGNAIKFTQAGTVTLNAKKDDDQVLIDVKDTGSGIDPEIMPRLFSKFATKSDQGTGLGLYISKRIIEAHGGRIWAENNKDGKGATFSLTLPLA